jgi:hypothetical protein
VGARHAYRRPHNQATSAWLHGFEWAVKGSNLRPWDQELPSCFSVRFALAGSPLSQGVLRDAAPHEVRAISVGLVDPPLTPRSTAHAERSTSSSKGSASLGTIASQPSIPRLRIASLASMSVNGGLQMDACRDFRPPELT